MVIGRGATTELLSEQEVFDICAGAFSQRKLGGKRILCIIPDNSRAAPIPLLFRVVYELLAAEVSKLDFLVASGTHPPLSETALNKRIGTTLKERIQDFPKARLYNHRWYDRNQLRHIGTISEGEIAEISHGLMREAVPVAINKMVFDYDLLVIIGPTCPHEVVGFSGGNKYFFPGIAGQEIIDTFHWLGALLTNPVINGKKDTPVRKVIDVAASFIHLERICLSLVVRGSGLAGLFIGTPEEAFSAAAELSEKIHIIYKDHPFRRVLSCAPEMYEDLWTAGKCMYKLEPVLAEGGELIIYAPHITEISVTHGAMIEKTGYHVRDYFVKQMDRFRGIPGGVRAHLTHVKGMGTFENGVERARVNVALATLIPKAVCERINLGYCDSTTIHTEEWENREHEGILYVPGAGEILYRLR